MKYFILFLTTLFILGCETEKKENEGAKKKLHHTVGFKWKEGAPLDSIKLSAQKTLGEIPLYAGDFQYGDNSVSSIDQQFARGHQHVLHVTFWSEFDRDSLYMPHPLHIKFGTTWGAFIDEIVVFDVWGD